MHTQHNLLSSGNSLAAAAVATVAAVANTAAVGVGSMFAVDILVLIETVSVYFVSTRIVRHHAIAYTFHVHNTLRRPCTFYTVSATTLNTLLLLLLLHETVGCGATHRHRTVPRPDGSTSHIRVATMASTALLEHHLVRAVVLELHGATERQRSHVRVTLGARVPSVFTARVHCSEVGHERVVSLVSLVVAVQPEVFEDVHALQVCAMHVLGVGIGLLSAGIFRVEANGVRDDPVKVVVVCIEPHHENILGVVTQLFVERMR
jgi:hypothetical protein